MYSYVFGNMDQQTCLEKITPNRWLVQESAVPGIIRVHYMHNGKRRSTGFCLMSAGWFVLTKRIQKLIHMSELFPIMNKDVANIYKEQLFSIIHTIVRRLPVSYQILPSFEDASNSWYLSDYIL